MNVGSKLKRELKLSKCQGMYLDRELVKQVQVQEKVHGHPGVSGAVVVPCVEMEPKLEPEHVPSLENVQETVNKPSNVIFPVVDLMIWNSCAIETMMLESGISKLWTRSINTDQRSVDHN